jgi:predicted tellurium resistance membrane protein TerC
MKHRKVIAGVLFFIACFIGASHSQGMWDDTSPWVFWAILFFAVGLGGFAMDMWKKNTKR